MGKQNVFYPQYITMICAALPPPGQLATLSYTDERFSQDFTHESWACWMC